MKRSLIKQRTAYTVTLPVDWIRERHLEPGDLLDIAEDQNALVLNATQKHVPQKASLALEESVDDYYRIMVENHYLKGYDVLELSYAQENAYPIIETVVSNLIGLEIVEQKKGYCKIIATALPSSEDFPTLLKRCFHIISYTQELVLQAMRKQQPPPLDEVEKLSRDARRLLLFCMRTLHKTQLVPRGEESFLHLLLERLILIEHDHLYLSRKLHKIPRRKLRPEVVGLYEKASRMFILFRDMFFKKDLAHFATINKYWKQIYFSEGHDLFEGCTRAESIAIYHAMHLSKLVFLIAQPNLTLQKI